MPSLLCSTIYLNLKLYILVYENIFTINYYHPTASIILINCFIRWQRSLWKSSQVYEMYLCTQKWSMDENQLFNST